MQLPFVVLPFLEYEGYEEDGKSVKHTEITSMLLFKSRGVIDNPWVYMTVTRTVAR
jgi:hypothetical protein